MPKKVLEIKDFTGGLNCFSDARDIKDSEFAQLWNANTSQTGLIKFGGSLVQNIIGLIHSNTNFQEGYGLFATGVDYSFNIIDGDFETPFEQGAIAGYASGTPSITLAANSTYQSKTNHDTANFYRNYAILIYSTADGNAPQGETRRITAYAADTHVATLDAAFSASPLTDGTEYYKIFKWIGDGVNFGNSGSTDYIDKSGSDFPYDDISSHNLDDSMNSYFLRTKVSSITDTQSKNLGFVTYNPSTAIDDTGAVATGEGAAFSEDSTTIGATTLKSGVEYTLSFFCKLNTRYFGYVSHLNECITNSQDRDISSGTINWIDYSPSTSPTYAEDTSTDDRIEITGTSGTSKEGAELGTSYLTTLVAGRTYRVEAKVYCASSTISGFKFELGGVATSAFAISTSTKPIVKYIQVTSDAALRIYYENASTTQWFIDDISVREPFGDRPPWIELYSSTVTDGTNTGLSLYANNTWVSTTEQAGYISLVDSNFIDNGDFTTTIGTEWTEVDLGGVFSVAEEAAGDAYGGHDELTHLTREQKEAKYDALKESIRHEGFNEEFPIIIKLRRVRNEDKIFQGHHRLNIAIELELPTVPVRFIT